jgi:hypothetical protein
MSAGRARQAEQAVWERILVCVELGRCRDHLLERAGLDLPALERLACAYAAAGLERGAADLRRRLAWYRSGSGRAGRRGHNPAAG